MAEDKISSIIDFASIQKEVDQLNSITKELATTLKNIPKAKVQVEQSGNLKEFSIANQKLIQETKAVVALVNQRFAAEAKVITLQSDYAKATANARVEQQKLNAELKVEAQLQQANSGSIERARAAVKSLSIERDRLNLFTKEGRDRQAELNNQIDKYNEFIRKNSDALAQQKINVGNYQGSAKIIVDAIEKEKQKLEELQKARISVQNAGSTFKPSNNFATSNNTISGQFGFGQGNRSLEEVNQQIEESKTKIQSLEALTSNPKFLNIAGKVGDATAELRFFTKALIDLERQGLGSSDAANQLRKQLAELTDQVADAKAEVKALSSDTRGFDLFAGSISFAADAFQTFAGAAVLAGASEEDAAEATKVLVAVQSISNGLKGIANELTTRGTAANKLYAFSQAQVTIALDSSAAATARLRAAFITLGIGAVVIGIGLLIANFSKLKAAFDDTSEAQKNLIKANETYTQALNSADYANAVKNVNELRINIQLAKDGFLKKEEVLQQYNETIGKTTGEVNSLDEAEKELVKNGDAYIQMTLLKAAANLALDEAAKKALEAEQKRLKSIDEFQTKTDKLGDKLNSLGSIGSGKVSNDAKQNNQRAIAEAAQLAEDRKAAAIKASEDEKNTFTEIAKGFQERAANIAKNFKFNFFDPNKDKEKSSKKDTQLSQLKDSLDNSFELYKIDQERKIRLLDDDIENDKVYYTDKLAALADYTTKSLDLLQKQEDEDIANANKRAEREKQSLKESKTGKTVAQVARINQNIKIVEENLTKELLLITKTTEDKRVELRENTNKRTKKILADQLDIQKEFEKDRLDFEQATADAEAKVKERLAKRLKAFDEAELVDIKERENLRVKLISDSIAEVEQLFFDAIDARAEKQKSAIDEEIADLDRATQKRIESINASGLAEAEKTRLITEAEKTAAFQKEQLEIKKTEVEKKQRTIRKVAAIAELATQTVLSVFDLKRKAAQASAEAALLASNPATAAFAPLAKVQAGLILAQIPGVIAASAISLAKLAFFKDGTMNAPKGPAVVGEVGSELIIGKNGEMSLSPDKPTLMNLAGGEKIIPADLTRALLGMTNTSSIVKMISQQTSSNTITKQDIDRLIKATLAPKNQRIDNHIHMPIESTPYYQFSIKN